MKKKIEEFVEQMQQENAKEFNPKKAKALNYLTLALEHLEDAPSTDQDVNPSTDQDVNPSTDQDVNPSVKNKKNK